MRFLKLKTVGLLVLLATLPLLVVADEYTTAEASNHLPASFGDFKASSPVTLSDLLPAEQFLSFGVISIGKPQLRIEAGRIGFRLPGRHAFGVERLLITN